MRCNPLAKVSAVMLIIVNIGLSHSLAVFAEGAGSPPRDPVIVSCTESQKDALKMAFKTVRATTTSSCIGTDLAAKLSTKFEERLTIQCINSDSIWLQTWWCDGNCGYGFPGDDMISICPGGFNSRGCGCLESVELHEFVHTAGNWGESVPLECEKSCFPSCCVIPQKWQPFITGCGCK